MSHKTPLSVLIPTRNEADNIAECVRSVAFASDIVVVDSESGDGTADIAVRQGARVVNFTWNREYPKKKNRALEEVDWKYEWILILDADERVTPELASEISRTIERTEFDGYYINRRFFFMGGWIRHCGYYPSWNLRLFRHRLGRYEIPAGSADTGSGDNEIHEHVVLRGKTARLHHELEHYAFPTIAAFVEKHNRYSSWEAVHWRLTEHTTIPELRGKRRWKNIARRLPFTPTLRFLYHYIGKRGFLDGYRGWVLCRLLGYYEFLSRSKHAELERGRNS